MKTSDFLKRYAYIYIYVVSACLLFGYFVGNSALSVNNPQSFTLRPTLVIDAGHGGMDGGTTSCTGVLESQFNLDISKRLERLLSLLGYETVMVRTEDVSVSTEGSTIREQKRSDLKNRVKLVNEMDNPIYISIHQNFYPESRYSGPQVFYASTEDSKDLATLMQTNLNEALTTSNKRSCKKSDGVYIMQHINCCGILIECGFLSNPEEESKLKTPEYQKKLCSVIAATLANHIEKATVS